MVGALLGGRSPTSAESPSPAVSVSATPRTYVRFVSHLLPCQAPDFRRKRGRRSGNRVEGVHLGGGIPRRSTSPPQAGPEGTRVRDGGGSRRGPAPAGRRAQETTADQVGGAGFPAVRGEEEAEFTSADGGGAAPS